MAIQSYPAVDAAERAAEKRRAQTKLDLNADLANAANARRQANFNIGRERNAAEALDAEEARTAYNEAARNRFGGTIKGRMDQAAPAQTGKETDAQARLVAGRDAKNDMMGVAGRRPQDFNTGFHANRFAASAPAQEARVGQVSQAVQPQVVNRAIQAQEHGTALDASNALAAIESAKTERARAAQQGQVVTGTTPQAVRAAQQNLETQSGLQANILTRDTSALQPELKRNEALAQGVGSLTNEQLNEAQQQARANAEAALAAGFGFKADAQGNINRGQELAGSGLSSYNKGLAAGQTGARQAQAGAVEAGGALHGAEAKERVESVAREQSVARQHPIVLQNLQSGDPRARMDAVSRIRDSLVTAKPYEKPMDMVLGLVRTGEEALGQLVTNKADFQQAILSFGDSGAKNFAHTLASQPDLAKTYANITGGMNQDQLREFNSTFANMLALREFTIAQRGPQAFLGDYDGLLRAASGIHQGGTGTVSAGLRAPLGASAQTTESTLPGLAPRNQ